MQASGIPSHISLSGEINNMNNKMEKLETCVRELYDVLPNTISEKIVKCIDGKGFHPLTRDEVNTIVNNALTTHMNEMKNFMSERTTTVEGGNNAQSMDCDTSKGNEGYRVYCWKGAMGRYVPQNFQFPSCDCRTMWNL